MTFKQLILAMGTIFIVASTLTTPSLMDFLAGLTTFFEEILPLLASRFI